MNSIHSSPSERVEVEVAQPNDGRDLSAAINRIAAQLTLFQPQPRRTDLLALPQDIWPTRQVRICVWRNHAIESLQPLIDVYARYAGLELIWDIGAYDDTLADIDRPNFDVGMVWYDLSRVTKEAEGVVSERLEQLRASTTKPLLIVAVDDDPARCREFSAAYSAAGTVHGDAWSEVAPNKLMDRRTAALTGTPVSRNAQTLLARATGCKWLPGLISPPTKLICVDLDNTLHEGALAEVGPAGVTVAPRHRALLDELARCRNAGVLVAIVSRNDGEDFENYIRVGVTLSESEFDLSEVSWLPKSEAIKRLLDKVRLSPEAAVFIDDNAGELLEVAAALPNIGLIEGGQESTAITLAHHPGIFRWHTDTVGTIRAADIHALEERERLVSESTPQALLEALGARVQVSVNALTDVPRATDLSSRTNQFNLSLARTPAARLEHLAMSETGVMILLSVRDRLSNSGTVALLAGEVQDGILQLEEWCISCRALGRNLENTLLAAAISGARSRVPFESVSFRYVEGPRNQPARQWLTSCTGAAVVDHEWISLPASQLISRSNSAVTISYLDAGTSDD